MSDLPATLDYSALVRASRKLNPASATQRIKIALLSDAATQQFIPLLRTLFHRNGVDASIYEGGFDGIALEALDPNSGLYRFEPDLIVVLNSVQALRAAYCKRAGDGKAFLEEKARSITDIWDAIQSRSSATLLQSNFVMPYERFFGNFDQKVEGAFSSIAAALNTHIAQAARSRPSVLINDVESVASWVGRRNWFDDRLWDIAKCFCVVDHLPLVAKNIVDIAMSARGRVVKCVVLDLDNTLWGGVIGDDGVDGILLNAHGDGEAFYRFQAWLKELRNRGILLAVCSKNEMNNALLPFEKHPDMLLRRSDMAAFRANWSDKAENISRIREELNIGFDSMVFLDDNPFERNLVRGVLPQVIVPELPEDAADYVRALSELNLFETTAFSAEDAGRTELYLAEAKRREEQAAFSSAEDFLKSLDMRIKVARFDSFHLARISQLFQRSNQFNLTTHRYTEAECEALMKNPDVLPIYASLSDRLGDHGLIGIIVAEPVDHELVIRDWLMSCRVLARGVEQYLMNRIFEEARERGLEAVRGEYIRTAKNDMVSDFLARFGFTRTGGDENHSRWILPVSDYKPSETFILPVAALAEV